MNLSVNTILLWFVLLATTPNCIPTLENLYLTLASAEDLLASLTFLQTPGLTLLSMSNTSVNLFSIPGKLIYKQLCMFFVISKGPLLGILLNNSPTFDLLAYCDANWVSCPHSRRSVSGFVVFFGNTLLTWKSKKQVTISLSSAEAEYRSMKRVVVELAWLSRLLNELTITSITPIPVKCDNQAAIYIAKNPIYHERTKHIELDCHFVGHKLMEGLINLRHVPTKH